MASLLGYVEKKIGSNRGIPRVWLEGVQPERAGFSAGVRYSAKVDSERTMLTLELVQDGVRIVSGKLRGERHIPVIDINSNDLLSIFDGYDSVRVLIQEGKIFIMPIASEMRSKARLQRLRAKLENGEPLTMGAVTAGVGVLDLAIHTGLEEEGIPTQLAFTNEVRDDCIEQAATYNKAYSRSTTLLNGRLQEVVYDQYVMQSLPQIDGLIAGLPCSGASPAGRTKNAISIPEAHPEVGHLVAPFIALISRVSPAFVVFENVPLYRSSSSMAIMRTSLIDLGYDVFETELAGDDWNSFEHRDRMCMVALTRGMPTLDFNHLIKPEKVTRRLAEIMDDVPLDDKSWSSMQYLKDKQERDAAASKGFAMNLVTAESTRVMTLNKTLAKRQSTGTFFVHPDDPNLQRLPTVQEHCRIKQIPLELVTGTNQTFGHEILGQSIIFQPFVSVGRLIGRVLNQMRSQFAMPLQSIAAV
ncbi:DNA cytosine methyltransferase [Duganella vulcania]|uniref:DNA cytosine methyltransferase n=1 Tax=Duganella vulcania TaxID=2692166 RepID=A0A845GFF2_9BURK|nr:DNA cytosine methyltransferase [Duganella vulcania]MYM92671.1 DNA cytosine methyltransferase [Duganella vulcania]